MTTTSPASNRRRATAAAVALALGIAGAALFVDARLDLFDVLGATPVAAAASDPAPVGANASTALDEAQAVATAATDLAVSAVVSPAGAATLDSEAVVGVRPEDPSGTAPDVSADPLSGVVVEPVDPAEALFGDHAAVAVSN